MVKVILQLYPVVRAEDEDERRRLRPLGRNVDRYQETVRGGIDVVKAADRLGLWGVGTIEHHFHSEGYEVGPSPGMLNAYWAAVTERIRVGQLGYTMSAQNPIRVAEDTAILDHLTQGRCFVGFSRGYQNRWTNILGQHLGTVATMSDHSADDDLNRQIFEEQVDMVLEAWTRRASTTSPTSGRSRTPTRRGSRAGPWPSGRPRWAPRARWAPTATSTASAWFPAPYTSAPPARVRGQQQQPSRRSSTAGARASSRPTSPASGPRRTPAPCTSKGPGSAGRKVALGQNQAIVRWPQIADSMADAREMVKEYDGDIFKHFYGSFLPAMHTGEAAPFKQEGTRAKSEEIVDAALKSGLWVIGDIPQVRDAFVAQWKQLPAEYVVLIMHFAQMPVDVVTRNLELFMSEIKPALDELVDYEDDGEPDVVVTTAG